MKRPVALIILDGLGIREKSLGNAVKLAKMPNFQALINKYPHSKIDASGTAVGLPKGQMGNSEVGHINIGAGRIVYQDLTRICKKIDEGTFYKNEAFTNVIAHVKRHNTKLHLLGLVSDGGVHSHTDHLYALLELAKYHELHELYIHCFLDGRDTPPRSAKKYIGDLNKKIRDIGVGRIASITGRYYAMDRDKRWERTKLAYDALVLGKGREYHDPIVAINEAYRLGENDEFVMPSVILDNEARVDKINNNDGIIFFNFRPDRARQMTRALVDKSFTDFERGRGYFPLHYVTMTLYDGSIENLNIAFEPQVLTNTLGEYLSKKGLKQVRIAETEKYAHVTYFFNGGLEAPNEGENRILIPSPQVATYDLKPEMSAKEVTDAFIRELHKDKYNFMVLNYANPDMVGHTGNLDAVVKALEVVDTCLGRLVEELTKKNGRAIITSDHGNSEELIDDLTGSPVTAHTTNPVPLILIGNKKEKLRDGGKLSDIGPTLLDIMGLAKPVEMTGKSLIIK